VRLPGWWVDAAPSLYRLSHQPEAARGLDPEFLHRLVDGGHFLRQKIVGEERLQIAN
jgi:hypothetical protein